jgi:hypothetical protein
MTTTWAVFLAAIIGCLILVMPRAALIGSMSASFLVGSKKKAFFGSEYPNFFSHFTSSVIDAMVKPD